MGFSIMGTTCMHPASFCGFLLKDRTSYFHYILYKTMLGDLLINVEW